MSTVQEILSDPNFLEAGRELQRAALIKADKNFAQQPSEKQNSILDTYVKGLTKGEQAVDKSFADKYRELAQSAAGAVGRGIETVTEPLVTGQRLLNRDEPIGQIMGGPVRPATHAPQTAQAVGESIVPQEPWQAGALAGSVAVPALGPLARGVPYLSRLMSGGGAIPRLVGATAGGEVGGQLSGSPTGIGALKGGSAQAFGELLGKGIGVAKRTLPGKAQRIAEEEAQRISQGVGEIVPEYAGQRTAQELGMFFRGGKGAQDALAAGTKQRLFDIEARPTVTGNLGVVSPRLTAWYYQLLKEAKSNPELLADRTMRLQPAETGEFSVHQANDIIALVRESLSRPDNPSSRARESGRLLDQLVDEVTSALEARSAGAGSAFTEMRENYKTAKGIQKLLRGVMNLGEEGFVPTMANLHGALADSKLTEHLSPQVLRAMNLMATRGASGQPGRTDIGTASEHFVPFTKVGAAVMALRKLLQRPRYQGRSPLTASEQLKSNLGRGGLLTIPSFLRPEEKEQ